MFQSDKLSDANMTSLVIQQVGINGESAGAYRPSWHHGSYSHMSEDVKPARAEYLLILPAAPELKTYSHKSIMLSKTSRSTWTWKYLKCKVAWTSFRVPCSQLCYLSHIRHKKVRLSKILFHFHKYQNSRLTGSILPIKHQLRDNGKEEWNDFILREGSYRQNGGDNKISGNCRIRPSCLQRIRHEASHIRPCLFGEPSLIPNLGVSDCSAICGRFYTFNFIVSFVAYLSRLCERLGFL